VWRRLEVRWETSVCFGIEKVTIFLPDIAESSAIAELRQGNDVNGGMNRNGREGSEIRCFALLVVLEMPADTQYFICADCKLGMGKASSEGNWSMTLLAPRLVPLQTVVFGGSLLMVVPAFTQV
jgi:hypothetical protein